MKKLVYILTVHGDIYRPQEPNVQDPTKVAGYYHPVCLIKKLLFGRWQIDYFCPKVACVNGGISRGDENTPNIRLILYPNGIQQIRYEKD